MRTNIPYGLLATLPLILILSTYASGSSCDSLPLSAIGKSIPNQGSHNPISVACAQLPDATDQSVVAIIYRPKNSEAYQQLLAIFIIANGSGEVLSSLIGREAPAGGVSERISLKIDTGRYFLSPNIRAIGVRSLNHGSGSGESEDIETLQLYVKEGRNLREVMADLTTNEDDELHPPAWYDGNCEHGSFHARRILRISKTSSHGFSDIEVTEKSQNVDKIETRNGCIEKTENRKDKELLHYNGNRYEVPSKFRSSLWETPDK